MGPLHQQTHITQFWVISYIVCFDNFFSLRVFLISVIQMLEFIDDSLIIMFSLSLVSPVEYFIFIIFLYLRACLVVIG